MKIPMTAPVVDIYTPGVGQNNQQTVMEMHFMIPHNMQPYPPAPTDPGDCAQCRQNRPAARRRPAERRTAAGPPLRRLRLRVMKQVAKPNCVCKYPGMSGR